MLGTMLRDTLFKPNSNLNPVGTAIMNDRVSKLSSEKGLVSVMPIVLH